MFKFVELHPLAKKKKEKEKQGKKKMAADCLTPHQLSLLVSGRKHHISYLHINAQSARNKADEIAILLESFEFSFDVIMVTETWYRHESDVLRIPSYATYFLNRSDKLGGGVMLLVKDVFECEILEAFSVVTDDYEIMTVKCSSGIFSVVYRPPKCNMCNFFTFLDTFLSWVNENGYNLTIGGDLNIDMLTSSPQRLELCNIMESNAFKNVINHPTRFHAQSCTLIDVIITNSTSAPLCSGVLKTHISDHLPVYSILSQKKLQLRDAKPPPTPFRYICPSTIDMFAAYISKIKWDAVFRETDADTAYNVFIERFSEAYNKCFPLKAKRRPRKARKPWITSECLQAIKVKNALYQKFLISRDKEDLKTFRKHRNTTNSLLRKSKLEYFSNLFSPEKTKTSEAIWKKLNMLLHPHSDDSTYPTKLIVDNRVLTGDDLAEAFNKFFTSIGESSHDNNFARFMGSQVGESAFLFPVTTQEVTADFMSLKNSRCCDVDGLEIRPVKHVIHVISPILEYIINLIFSLGTFPSRLQIAKVSIIFKGGDKNSMTNYRPISILPVFSKVIEKLLHKRIVSFLTKHHIMTPFQFGFTKQRSTETALLMQKEIILDAFEKEIYTLGIFVDFSKAFDRINHITLIKKLEHYGFRGNFISVIKTYLKYRQQKVDINGYASSFKKLSHGVPQGSILGPLLFNLYVNDLTNIDNNTTFIIYADDTSLFFKDCDLHKLVDKANSVLKLLHIWSIRNSLIINTSKTKSVLFRPINKPVNCDLSLVIGSESIRIEPIVKTLGVFFHENMLWKDQAEFVHAKLSRTVGILSRLRFLLPQKIKLLLYNSLFLSTLSYCYLVWGTTSEKNLGRIYRLQKKAVRIITGVPRDEHSKPIFEALNLQPMPEIYNTILMKRYRTSLKNHDSFLTDLARLTPYTCPYSTRATDDWKIPYTRTNYGRQMMSYLLPLTLNSFLQ